MEHLEKTNYWNEDQDRIVNRHRNSIGVLHVDNQSTKPFKAPKLPSLHTSNSDKKIVSEPIKLPRLGGFEEYKKQCARSQERNIKSLNSENSGR